MSTFTRFFPFLQPYLPRMAVAGLLIMGVAAINLALLRLAGKLWDVITVQHDQLSRPEPVELAAQFRPDGPAGAGHQDPPAGEAAGHRGHVRLYRLAAEQVSDLRIAHAA